MRRTAPLLLARYLLAALPLMGAAYARTIRIVQAGSLEINTVDGQELIVLRGEANTDISSADVSSTDKASVDTSSTGQPVVLRLSDTPPLGGNSTTGDPTVSDTVRARRIEFNRTRRTLTLVGQGEYDSVDAQGREQHLRGENLVVLLDAQSLSGEDVLVSDGQLSIQAAEVERVPGRLVALSSYFTACARCGRTPNDYAVKASRLVLYPGDRLIAYGATILLADTPVFYLPVLAVPLNDRARQPRFSIGNDATDGLTIKADLPFAAGESVLGTTLLRYYQNRPAHFGVGVDMSAYAPTRLIDRLDLYALALPKSLLTDGAGATGYDLDFRFGVKGHVDMARTLSGLNYTFSAARRQIDLYPSDSARGITFLDGGAQATFTDVPYVKAVGVRLDLHDRRAPTSDTSATAAALAGVYKRPELSVDPGPISFTTARSQLSADFSFKVGNYLAASNPLNRAVTRQSLNFNTWRLEEQHQLSYAARPWKNAEVVAYNTFTGHYYLSGQRVVNLDTGVSLTQYFGVRPLRSSDQRPFDTQLGGGAVSNSRGALLNTEALPAGLNTAALTGSALTSSPLNSPLTSSVAADGTRYLPPYDSLTQRVAGSWTVGFKYLRREGLSPFAFDRLDSTLISAPINLGLNLTPTAGITLSASQNYDLLLPATEQEAARFGVNVARKNVLLNLLARYNFFDSTLEELSGTGTLGPQTSGVNFGFSGGYVAGGSSLLTTSVSVLGRVRTSSATLSVTTDLAAHTVQTVSVSASGVRLRDAVLRPLTFSIRETLNVQTQRLDGAASVGWRSEHLGDLVLSTTHSLSVPGSTDTAQAARLGYDTLYFSIGTASFGGGNYGVSSFGMGAGYSGSLNSGWSGTGWTGTGWAGTGLATGTWAGDWYNAERPPAALAWNLSYGGPYDVSAHGWATPALTLAITAERLAQAKAPSGLSGASSYGNTYGYSGGTSLQRLSAQASLALPGTQRTGGPYLQSASLGGLWQFGSRAAISGLGSYTRSDTPGLVQETLSLQPLTFTTAIGPRQRPAAYLSATFMQTLTWQNGVRTDSTPFRPIVLLTVDRCCWSFQAEVNPIDKSFRLGFVLAGGPQVSAFEYSRSTGVSFPFSTLDGQPATQWGY